MWTVAPVAAISTACSIIIVSASSCVLNYEAHSKAPQPYGFRVNQLINDLNLSRNEVLPFKIPVTPPWRLPEVTFCKYFSGCKRERLEEEIRSIFMEHVVEHRDSTLIFTDGSKSDAGVGYGVSSTIFNRKGALPTVASNFTAELHGILAAVEKIATLDHGNFTIFCDARSVLQALGIFNPTNPLVLKILQWVHIHECRNIQIKFCWVPAHVNVSGNEKADELAKSAATELLPRRCPLPCCDFFPSIRHANRNVWQQRWDDVGPNKMREITRKIAPWRYSRMPRRWETALCRLRIGHTRLTHDYLMAGRSNPPFCDDCLVPLTVRHLLVECPSLGELRERFLSGSRSGDGSYILAEILGEDVFFMAVEFLGIL